MSYQLTRPDALDSELKRIVLECMVDAAAQLKHKRKNFHEGIHKTRKCIKEIRAVLRLIRTELGPAYAEENAWFRKQANSLSALRDAKAMLEICDQLSSTFAGQLDYDPFPALHVRLNNRLKAVMADHPQLDHELAALQKALKHAQTRVHAWPLRDKGFGVLENGLRNSYQAGRAAYRKCQSQPGDADFHAWRKRVKEHWCHTLLLVKTWPGELDGRELALKQLADLLGAEHDLLVLQQLVNKAPKDFGSRGEVKHLLVLIDCHRQQLQTSALSFGARLYAEKPAAHTRRLAAYWACWEEEFKKA
jgi:hypothetical protein